MKNTALAALIGGSIVAALSACSKPPPEDPHAHCAMQFKDATPDHPLCPDSPDKYRPITNPTAPYSDPNLDLYCATLRDNDPAKWAEPCYLNAAHRGGLTAPGGDAELVSLGRLVCKTDPNDDNRVATDQAVYAAQPNIGLDLSQIKYPLKGDDAKYNGATEINSLAHIWLCPPADS